MTQTEKEIKKLKGFIKELPKEARLQVKEYVEGIELSMKIGGEVYELAFAMVALKMADKVEKESGGSQ